MEVDGLWKNWFVMKVDGPLQYLKVNMNGIFCKDLNENRLILDRVISKFLSEIFKIFGKKDYFSVFGCGSNDDFALGSLKWGLGDWTMLNSMEPWISDGFSDF